MSGNARSCPFAGLPRWKVKSMLADIWVGSSAQNRQKDAKRRKRSTAGGLVVAPVRFHDGEKSNEDYGNGSEVHGRGATYGSRTPQQSREALPEQF